jgi:catecholate siderophore receptor
MQVQLNVENLFDEEYYPNAHNNNNISPGAPLGVRVGVTASF